MTSVRAAVRRMGLFGDAPDSPFGQCLSRLIDQLLAQKIVLESTFWSKECRSPTDHYTAFCGRARVL